MTVVTLLGVQDRENEVSHLQKNWPYHKRFVEAREAQDNKIFKGLEDAEEMPSLGTVVDVLTISEFFVGLITVASADVGSVSLRLLLLILIATSVDKLRRSAT